MIFILLHKRGTSLEKHIINFNKVDNFLGNKIFTIIILRFTKFKHFGGWNVCCFVLLTPTIFSFDNYFIIN